MSFDAQAKTYDKVRGGLDRGRQAAEDLADYLVPGTVLDVGVGTGAVAIALREFGHEVTGVDTSEQMLEVAADRLGADSVQLGDAQSLPFADGSFANVVMAHLLHLVPDMPSAIAEGARVLEGGGRLLAIHGHPIGREDDLIEATRALQPLQEDRPDTAEAVAVAASAAGLRWVAQDTGTPFRLAMTPTEFADNITERRCPYLFDVSESSWRALVDPSLQALRALPDQDRPRVNDWRMQRAVFEKA